MEKILIFLIAAAVALAGCAKEEITPPVQPAGGEEKGGSGETQTTEVAAEAAGEPTAPVTAAEEESKDAGSGEAARLIEKLKSKDLETRLSAMEALVKMGEPAIGPLVYALKNEDEDIRRNGASVLAKIGEPALEALMRALKEKDVRTRENAVWALGEIGDERALEPLIEALRDKFITVRRSAIWALGKMGDKRAVKPLKRALGDRDRDVRVLAEKALAKIEPPEPPKPRKPAEPAGKEKVGDTPQSTVRAYLEALGNTDGAAIYEYLCSRIIDEAAQELQEHKGASRIRKRVICKQLGVTPGQLDRMTTKEYYILVFGKIQDVLEAGELEGMAEVKVVDCKIEGDKARVGVSHPRERGTRAVELVREKGLWKIDKFLD